MQKRQLSLFVLLLAVLTACSFGFDDTGSGGSSSGGSNNIPAGEDAVVTKVVDGDTIDVTINGTFYAVRYLDMNTPERDQSCYQEAKDANAAYVKGQTVHLVKDVSETDQYGRLLRYVYVGSTMVNQALTQNGWAEAVCYEPDCTLWDQFIRWEKDATNAGLGCHPTGIFDDGSYRR